MNKSVSYKIFQQGSTTFFSASLLFPRDTKEDVFNLYAFVRTCDDFVDSIPQQSESFYAFKNEYYAALQGTLKEGQHSNIISQFIALQKKYAFEEEWIAAFFNSMESDLTPRAYSTLAETEQYMYGSAEVMGLMMAKIMLLPPESFMYAQKLGRAFQYMNMMRDIAEDLSFGRVYLPSELYKSFGLSALTQSEAEANPEAYDAFIRSCIKQYNVWRSEAIEGFTYIPSAYLRPIKIALSLFDYTVHEIYKKPFIVFEKKIKPSKIRIAVTTIKEYIA